MGSENDGEAGHCVLSVGRSRRPADRRRRRRRAGRAQAGRRCGAGEPGSGSVTAPRWRRRPCADIERLRGPTAVRIEAGDRALRLALALAPGMAIRATGKPGDGLVSRWLNRPISQRITWLVLAIPGVRPIHVTISNRPCSPCRCSGACSSGGTPGLILGAILFQAASVLDGVDGEMARATFRATSPDGATLDSLVDMSSTSCSCSASPSISRARPRCDRLGRALVARARWSSAAC